MPALLQALHDSRPYVRRSAVEALQRIGPGAVNAVSALAEVLDDADQVSTILLDCCWDAHLDAVSARAAAALLTIEPVTGLSMLLQRIKEIRRPNQHLIGEVLLRRVVPTKEMIPAITRALKSPDADVRLLATALLRRAENTNPE